MGVRGLQSFLKDNHGSLCDSVILDQVSDGEEKGSIPIVVDAWGIIYKLYLDSLPWTSGGEYLRYYKLVKDVVKAWRRVGLEPTFVFDGATPPAKHETVIKRLAEQITTCKLFFTTSAPSRSERSFSKNVRPLLPPLASHTFLYALSRLNVDTHFVPLGEADGVCVLLAEKLGAHVVSQDSDFVILVGRAGERVKGYCPLDMMSWIEGKPPVRLEPQPEPEPELPVKSNVYVPPSLGNRPAAPSIPPSDEFITVHNRKHTSYAPRQSPLLPPTEYRNPALVLTNYHPQGLRRRLRLPPNYLPLFASLCGNDYTPPSAHHQFFEPSLSSSQKIEKAARILREQLFAPSNSPKSKSSSSSARSTASTPNPADQVVELVKRTVKKLCIFPFDTEQALLDMVDCIIDGALEYALPQTTECCSTYPFCGELDSSGCQTPQNHSDFDAYDQDGPYVKPRDSPEEKNKKLAVQRYANARQRGWLPSITPGWLYPDRIYVWGVLEDPSMGTVCGTQGSRAIRRAAWTIAAEGLGGLRVPDEPEPEDAVESQAVESKSESSPMAEEKHPQPDSKIKVDRGDEKSLRELLGVTVTSDSESSSSSSTDGERKIERKGKDGTTTAEHDSDADLPAHRDVNIDLSDLTLVERPGSSLISGRGAHNTTITVYEWLRQGSTSKMIRVPLELQFELRAGGAKSKSESAVPVCLQPLEARLSIYLSTLQSDTEQVRDLPIQVQPFVAIVRHCILDASARASQSQSQRSSETAKWKRDEVAAILHAGLGTWSLWSGEFDSEIGPWGDMQGNKKKEKGSQGDESGFERGILWPLLETRNAHLVAQLSQALACGHLLAQALLLDPDADADGSTSTSTHGEKRHTEAERDAELSGRRKSVDCPNDDVPSNGSTSTVTLTHLIPFVFFSGVTLHSMLLKKAQLPVLGVPGGSPPGGSTQAHATDDKDLVGRCWTAITDGMEGHIVGLHVPPGKSSSLTKRANGESESEGGQYKEGEGEELNSDGDSDGARKRKKKEKKKKARKSVEVAAGGYGKGLGGKGSGSGRFDLLGELGD